MKSPNRRRLGVLALLFAALFGLGLALAGAASAHASVVSSDPADGSRLKAAPHQVTITFDESVTLGNLGYLHVTDAKGHRVDTGTASHPGGNGTKITTQLRSGLGDGTYIESYRVISADSHPVAGVVRFVVGTGVLSVATASGSTVNHGTSALFAVARWVSYAGFALLGGTWLLLTVWPGGRDDLRARRLIWTGWGATALGALGELVLQGPYAAGRGPSAVGRWSLLDDTLHTDYGQYHCARLLLLGALAVLFGAMLQPRRRARFEDAAWPLLVGVALTFSVIGHADTTKPNWLSITLDVLHLCAMAVWVGGLVLLVAAVLPRREPAELRAVLPAFSRVAFVAVIVIAVTGTYAAWRGIGAWRAILGTNYGLLVCAKVLLFCGLIALGQLSRRAIQRRAGLVDGGSLDGVAHERMRRSVLVEVALAVLVLVATAVLVDQPRGTEALAASDREPVTAGAQLGGGHSVMVTVDPGVHGPVSVSVELSPGTRPKRVTATALQPAKQLGPIPVPLRANGTDLYGASNVNLPVKGTWVITLVVTTSAFDAVTTDVKITLH
ncbi:MAG TPA: copper resistance protein CopC [Jatrophihabitantaceae bacterium]|nr:copper resistance protein CopC [Jatrophihabitantaceae bacterium]